MLVSFILTGGTVFGASKTWNGAGSDNNWNTGANWGGTAPVANDSLFFAGSTRLGPTNNITADTSFTGITFNSGAGAFTLSGNRITLGGDVTNSSTNLQTINLAMILSANRTFTTLTGGGNLTIGGILSETGGARGIIKAGAGTLTLSGANTYTGGTTFNAGTVSISSDANLGASSGGLTFNGGTLAATSNVLGTRAINMTGAGTFSPSFGTTLEESGAVSGNGNLTVANSGTLILSGSGSNGTGTTTVSGAALSLRGTVSLGSGNLTLSGGLLELGNGNFTRALGAGAGQVNMSSATGGAGFAAYGADRTVNLGGSGATVTWGAGNFVNSGQTLYLGTPTADHMVDFQNSIDLSGAVRTITVTHGVGTGVDAKISGVISGTGTSGLTITSVGFAPWNPGTLTLSGANTYTGATTVSAGTLNIQNNTGLGTTAAGTTVSSGATLQLQNSITVGAETLTISGTGASGQNGALVNVSGTNNYGGLLTLGAASTISSDGGTLNLTNTGTITGATFGLTLTGSGDGTISSIIGTTTGTLTKSGTGTWTLTGANTYTGATTVNGGDLSTGTFTLSTTGTVSIASGATYTSTGVLNLTADSTAAQTFISGAGTLRLRNSSSTALAPDIYYAPGSGTFAANWPVTIASNVDVGTGSRFINGQSNRNDYERYGGDLVFSGNLSGSANLTFTGLPNTGSSGPIPWQMAYTLAGNNSAFTGGIILTDGANLTLNNANALTSANTVTFTPASGAVSGLYLYGRNVTIGALSGTSAGTMNIRNGSLVSGDPSPVNPNIVRSNATLTVQQDTNTTFNGVIGDGLNDHGTGDTGTYYTLGLTKTGTGTLTLGGANTYTGVTTISAGALSVGTIGNGGVSGNLGAATNAAANLVFDGGTLQYTGATASTDRNFTINTGKTATFDITTNTLTVSGASTATNGALTKIGAGTLTLSGANTYTGATTISAGTLSANKIVVSSSNSSLGNATSAVILGDASNQGTLSYTGAAATYTRGFTINAGGGQLTNAGSGLLTVSTGGISAGGLFTLGGATGKDITITSVISNTGGLTKTGADTVTLSGANTYTGVTNINVGTLKEGAANVITDTSAVTVAAGATYDLNSFSETIGSLAGGGTVTSGVAGALTLTSGGDNTSTLFSGVVQNGSGTLALTKIGTGTQTLSGANTYTGATTISDGTLSAGNIVVSGGNSNLGNATSAVVLGGASTVGTLSYTGSAATYTRGFTVNAGGGGITNAGTALLTIGTGGITDGGNLTFATNANGITVNSVISSTGSVTMNSAGAGALTLTGANTYTGKTSIANGTLSVASLNKVTGSSASSNLGAPTTVANGTIDFGATTTTGTLVYTGTGETTDRVVNLAGTTGGATLDQSGTGLLKFTSASTATGAGSKTFTLQGSTAGTGEISGAIVDNSATNTTSVTKSGTGTWTLSGANTYTGNTTVSAGTLTVAAAGSLTGTDVTVGTGATLNINGSINTGSSKFLTLEGTATLNGGGLLSTAHTFVGSSGSGTFTQSGGTHTTTFDLYLGYNPGSSGTYTLSAGSLSTGRWIFVGDSGSGTFNLSGSGSLSSTSHTFVGDTGSGTFTQSGGTNTVGDTLYLGYSSGGSGIYNLNGGTLTTITIARGSGTGTFNFNGGTLKPSQDNTSFMSGLTAANVQTGGAKIDSNGFNITVGQVLLHDSGGPATDGGLNKLGSGTLTLSGANTYTGATAIQNGALSVTSLNKVTGGSATSNLGAPTTTANGTIALGSTTTTGQLTYTGSGETTDRVINLAGTTGGGTLDQSGTGLLKFTSANTATGAGSKTLTLQGSTAGTGEISGAIVDNTGTNKTSLTKAGSGTWTLSGTNTYTGATTVNAGSLFVNGSTASGSAVTVNSSGTTLGGNGTINGSVNVASSGANISPGATAGTTAILHTGALTLASGANFNVDLNGTTAGTLYDQLSVTGTVSISGSNLVITAGSGLNINDTFFILLNDSTDSITGTFAQGTTITASNNGDMFSISYTGNGDSGSSGNDILLTVTAIPEPSTWVAAALALGGLAFTQRRRFARALKCVA